MYGAALRHLRSVKAAGVRMVPKHHHFLHMSARVREYGHPSKYATWLNESDNNELAPFGAKAHSLVWFCRVWGVLGVYGYP